MGGLNELIHRKHVAQSMGKWLFLLLLLLFLFSSLCIFPAKPYCCILLFLHLLYSWCLSLCPFSFNQLIYMVLDPKSAHLYLTKRQVNQHHPLKMKALISSKSTLMSHDSRNNEGYSIEQNKATEFAEFITPMSSVTSTWCPVNFVELN